LGGRSFCPFLTKGKGKQSLIFVGRDPIIGGRWGRRVRTSVIIIIIPIIIVSFVVSRAQNAVNGGDEKSMRHRRN